jgi:hypothetical protein
MEAYWKLTLGKRDVILTAFFQKGNDLFEVKTEQELYVVEDIDINKIKVLKNGSEFTNISDSELFNLKEMFYKKRRILPNQIFSIHNPLETTDVVPIIICSNNEVVNLAFQGDNFYIEFDSTFYRALRVNTFMEAVISLKETIGKTGSNYSHQKVLTRDSILFEEYLLIQVNYCLYFGFVDNETAESPQEVFKVPLRELKELVDVLMLINELNRP